MNNKFDSNIVYELSAMLRQSTRDEDRLFYCLAEINYYIMDVLVEFPYLLAELRLYAINTKLDQLSAGSLSRAYLWYMDESIADTELEAIFRLTKCAHNRKEIVWWYLDSSNSKNALDRVEKLIVRNVIDSRTKVNISRRGVLAILREFRYVEWAMLKQETRSHQLIQLAGFKPQKFISWAKIRSDNELHE